MSGSTDRLPAGWLDLPSQDLIITVLGSYMGRSCGRFWSGGMVKLSGEFGFSTDAVRAALARLVTRGFLERHRDGRMINYALTPRARELLAEGDRRIFSFGRRAPGADAWTILWHTIPEDRRVERSRFAARLRFLGFGSLQDGTWIAASDREEDVRALAEQLGLDEYVSIFLARISRGSEAAIAASDAWELAELTPRYTRFIEDFGRLAAPEARSSLTDHDAFIARTRLMHSFRDFSLHDPELPDSILPLREVRLRAVAIFDAVYEGLSAAAGRYFEAVAVPAHLEAAR